MANGLNAIVSSQPPVVSPVGLLSAGIAETSVEGSAGRWTNGLAFDPYGCADAEVLAFCAVSVNPSASNPDDVEYIPIVLEYTDQCSVLTRGRNGEERARAGLKVSTQKALEYELWTGTLAQAQSYDNLYLTSGATSLNSGTAMAAGDALACLEDALASADGGGALGMIHATRKTVSKWKELNLIEHDGSRLVTVNGTIVVSGAGYPGTDTAGAAPSGGDHFAYATDPVHWWLGPIETVDAGEIASTVDREVNTQVFYAWRFAAATWSGCRHFAVNVNLAAC